MTTMTSSKPGKPDIRLHVRFEDSPYNSFGTRYAHVHVMPVVIARRNGDTRADAHDIDSYSIDVPAAVRALAGLKIRAQLDDSTAQKADGQFYGYRVAFSTDELTLADAERILPVLRRIDKRMTALSDRFGYPRDLETFLAHLADALGLAGQPFVRKVTDDNDYEGNGHRSMTNDSLRWWLADQVQAWRERHHVPGPARD